MIDNLLWTLNRASLNNPEMKPFLKILSKKWTKHSLYDYDESHIADIDNYIEHLLQSEESSRLIPRSLFNREAEKGEEV
jgi:hypothetical protein